MKDLFKKNNDVLLIVLFALLVFVLRIINLTQIPIFTDEAIYIRWAQIGLDDPAHRYISLTDGKQPLLTWAMYPFLPVFKDPLFAGRFVSVLAGVFSVIGIYLLSKTLFNRVTAVFASILYLFSPFAQIYDRLALMDSLLASFAVWSLYLQVLQIKFLRLDIALLLGGTVGLGLLTKSSAMFFLYLVPFSLILFNFYNKAKLKNLLKWLSLSLLSSIIALIFYNSLRLSPFFYIIEQKNYSFILTFSEFLSSPFRLFLPNLNGLFTFLRDYLTVPVLLLVLINTVYGFIRFERKIILLFLWFIIPFLALAAFGKVLFPRFILFMTYPLIIIAANQLSKLFHLTGKLKLGLILPAIFLILPVYISFIITTDPVKAPIHEIDRNQLFDDWPSGYGVKEVIEYIENEAQKGKVVIATEGTFGLNPAVYEIYLQKNLNVTILGYWPVFEVPEKLIEYAKTTPTYLVFKEKQEIPKNWPLRLVSKYKRGQGNTYLFFFRVVGENEKS